MPSVSRSALLQRDMPQHEKDKLLRRYAVDDMLPPWNCYAVRTPSAGSKFQQRQGARKVKQI